MKLRIRGDSLRFRVSQGEASRLLAKENVSESVHFIPSPAGQLTYSLRAREDATRVTARFGNGEILVELPTALVEPWAKTDQVGIEAVQPIGEGRDLRIVVEKDFRCLQPRSEEDESDNFPNPEETRVS